MANVLFKRGLQANLPKSNIIDGAFYLTTDTNRLYIGNNTELVDYSDWKMIDGKYYCPECYEASIINDTYTVKVKD